MTCVGFPSCEVSAGKILYSDPFTHTLMMMRDSILIYYQIFRDHEEESAIVYM